MDFVLVTDIHTESNAYEPTMHTHRWDQKRQFARVSRNFKVDTNFPRVDTVICLIEAPGAKARLNLIPESKS